MAHLSRTLRSALAFGVLSFSFGCASAPPEVDDPSGYQGELLLDDHSGVGIRVDVLPAGDVRLENHARDAVVVEVFDASLHRVGSVELERGDEHTWHLETERRFFVVSAAGRGGSIECHVHSEGRMYVDSSPELWRGLSHVARADD